MISEYDIVGVVNEFAMPVYVGQGQVARLTEQRFFYEEPYRLKQGHSVSEQDQLREIIRSELEKRGITERTHISMRDPQELEAGNKKMTFVYLGFLQ